MYENKKTFSNKEEREKKEMKLKKILITSGVVVAGAVITTIIVVANAGKGKHHGHEETKPTDPILTTPTPSETIPTETSLPSVVESTTETAIEESL